MNKTRCGAAMALVVALMAGCAGSAPMVVADPEPADNADMIHLRAECAAGDLTICQVVQIGDRVAADMARFEAEEAAQAAAPPTLVDLFAVGLPGLLLGQRANGYSGGGFHREDAHGHYSERARHEWHSSGPHEWHPSGHTPLPAPRRIYP